MSVFVNMAEGTSYGIVPYMIPEELAVVSAMVGAGGTLGALIATRLCYMTTEDDLLPFRLHAGYVLFWAFTVFFMQWNHLGSMFGGPKKEQISDAKETKEASPEMIHKEIQNQKDAGLKDEETSSSSASSTEAGSPHSAISPGGLSDGSQEVSV